MPTDDTMQAPLPIDLARTAAEWGQSLDELHAALAVERAREARDSRPGRTRRRRVSVQRPSLGPEYGWCDW
jgi:hypothetical protein